MPDKNIKFIADPTWKWQYQHNQPILNRQSSRLGKLIFQSIIAFAVAALFAFIFHRVLFAGIVAGIGLLILISGLFIPKLYAEFEKLTGSAVIINTSFNVRGEPIVCTPEDAYRCSMRTEMDYLVLGPYMLDKREQPPWHEKSNWRLDYVLD